MLILRYLQLIRKGYFLQKYRVFFVYCIGIDLGGTNIAAGIVNSDYKIIYKGSVPTGASREGKEIINDMVTLCRSLVSEAGLTFDDISYLGIAYPGAVDPEKGVAMHANNLPFENFAVADTIKSLLPVKRVALENDANAAALGEAVAGAARGVSRAVMVTIGTGIGGGIVIDGKVYSGFNYAGGELGHIVIEQDGVPCTCGRIGCWEAYSSATALIRMTKEKIGECAENNIPTLMTEDKKVSGKTAFAAMRRGDIPAKEVVDKYLSYLACGISSMITVFEPEIVVIGGGVCNEGKNLTDPLEALICDRMYGGDKNKSVPIKIAELGNDAGIIGAALAGA